jgi:hypothetical protein
LVYLPEDWNAAEVQISTLPRDIFMDLNFTEIPAIDFQYTQRAVTHAMLDLAQLYSLMISRWSTDERIEANEQPLRFLVPLLELYVGQFQAIITYHYKNFRRLRAHPDEGDAFSDSWRPLRDAMVNPTWPFEAFRQYDSCHANGVVQRSSKLQRASKRFDRLLQNASKLERHMLEELQLQVGHLSLQESKESIKQSKIAIEESKRVKMRTLCCPRH